VGVRRAGLGGRAAVAAAAALLAVCAAGGPLYVSAAASQAVQVQLDDGCLADDGMHLHLGPSASARAALDTAVGSVPHVAAPVVTTISQAYTFLVGPDRRRVVLMQRDGQADHLGDGMAAPRPGEVLLPDWYLRMSGVAVGDRLAVTIPAPLELDVDDRPLPQSEQPPPATMALTVAGAYPGIPVRPEPAFWCGQRTFFRPNQFGDPPLPVGFVDASTLHGAPFEQLDVDWELRPDPGGLTRDQARSLQDDYDRLAATYADAYSVTVRQLQEGEAYTTGLSAVLDHALTLSDVVARTVAPVRLTGVAASVALLGAAGVLVARERRRDLRLRLLCGVSPARLAVRMGGAAALAAVVGTAAGVGMALLAVVTLGPTPELEPAAVRRAVLAAAVGLVIAIVLVGVMATAAANATVDARTRPLSLRRLAGPLVLGVAVLTVVSYVRLDRIGGVRLVGSEAHGGDLLAQAFPLLAVAAPLLLIAWPLSSALRRARFAGRRLRPALLLGVRRVVVEPAMTVTLVLVIALATGTYVVAGALTSSAEQTLRDKAATFLGSDLVVGTVDPGPLPEHLAPRGTLVARAPLRSGDYGVDLLAVDTDTFARAVRWRDDAASSSLGGLLGELHRSAAQGQPVPAIVVGRPLDTVQLRSVQGFALPVRPVTAAAFFPGYHNGATLVVVDRAALPAGMPGLAEELWLKDPPPDALDQLRSAGITVLSPRQQADVFEVTSFLTVRWSYGALAAFGILVALVVLLAQLLVLDARRGARQAAFVLTRRMGHRVSDEALAVFTELAVPFVGGAALGTALALAVCRLAVPRLDSLRQLEPPARVVVDPSAMLPLVVAAAVALVVLTAIGVAGVVRARPMEVLRATA
jgi:hypothetical protein